MTYTELNLNTHKFSSVAKMQYIYGQKRLIGIIENSEYYGMFWCDFFIRAFHPLTFSLDKNG